jgi:hypothetical protein
VLVEDIAAGAGVSKLPDPQWTVWVRLMLSKPALIGEFLKAGMAAERECAAAIAERIDVERSTPRTSTVESAAPGSTSAGSSPARSTAERRHPLQDNGLTPDSRPVVGPQRRGCACETGRLRRMGSDTGLAETLHTWFGDPS